jgi:hypothetical protein
MFGKTADITVVTEESNQYLRMVDCLQLRPRIIIEESPGLAPVSLPQKSEGKNARLRTFVSEKGSEQFSSNPVSFEAVSSSDALPVSALTWNPHRPVEHSTTSILKQRDSRASIAECASPFSSFLLPFVA